MFTYEQAALRLKTRKNVPGFATPKPIKVANNTFLCYRAEHEPGYTGPDIVIRLHQNPVIYLHADSSYTLFDAGWRTSTTRGRLNSFSPFYVTSVWEVRVGAKFMQFKDGMNIRQIPA